MIDRDFGSMNSEARKRHENKPELKLFTEGPHAFIDELMQPPDNLCKPVELTEVVEKNIPKP